MTIMTSDKKGTHSSFFCASVSCRRSMPDSSVPIAGVRCVTCDAADNSAFFSGSANCARSVTGNSVRGSHLTLGK